MILELFPPSRLALHSATCQESSDDDDDLPAMGPDISLDEIYRSVRGQSLSSPDVASTALVEESGQCPICEAYFPYYLLHDHADTCATLQEQLKSGSVGRDPFW